MPKRKHDWSFTEGTYRTAAELAIPFSRLYNALTSFGKTKIADEEDLKGAAMQLQQKAIPFRTLIKIFGPSITLGQLEQLEEAWKAVPHEPVEKTAKVG